MVRWNIDIEEDLIRQIEQHAQNTGQTCDIVIQDALKAWAVQHIPKPWPKSIMEFQGYPDAPRFESTRDE